ncbi:hypothetical protein PF005_g20367 [Phytophthora fragariae]|uniref:Reverse transcriptase domain-containing protein n=1 Tax=Phytophthora fragariae TaxID=53985 RepID=A0A6A3WM84_9STRA|nr:hypothetical protein PF005_g20367 [Phytophthora fragariae]KAE9217872.1 hypothetical protein PF002_g16670 [Phytophthora fragariae]
MRGLHAHNDGRERLLPQRSDEDSDDSADGLPVGNDPAIEPADLPEVDQDAPTGVTPPRMAGEIEFTDEPPSEGDAPEMDTLPEGNIADPVAQLEQTFVSVLRVLNMEGNKDSAGANEGSFEHQAHGVELEDYEQELAFLPDLTEGVKEARAHHDIEWQRSPSPAYGVVYDIDVKGHAPIKQRARRVPLRYLRKPYELLKGLLKAGLLAFSDNPWVSPIVIVLKKNGLDIRLCIDYKLVNAITAVMEYAMPLVDDLLTDLEAHLWFCSLDAASGFWAIMMTLRARKISAFVCALGHFKWLRMPFGLKNAPMIYQRMIVNALWGFVQAKRGWQHYATLMRTAEE